MQPAAGCAQSEIRYGVGGVDEAVWVKAETPAIKCSLKLKKELQQKIKRRSSCTKSKNSLALRAAIAMVATTKNLIVYQVQV